jgi:hypothetical protein
MIDITIPTDKPPDLPVYLKPLVGSIWDTEVIPGAEKLSEAGKQSIDRIGFFERPQTHRFAWSLGVKDQADTNMCQAACLPNPSQFWITAFSFKMLDRDAMLPDDIHMIGSGLFQFIFSGDRTYFERPIDEMAEGMDPSKDWLEFCDQQISSDVVSGVFPEYITQALARSAEYFAKLENPPVRVLLDGGHALALRSQEMFRIRLLWPSGLRLARPARVRATMWGIRFQPI